MTDHPIAFKLTDPRFQIYVKVALLAGLVVASLWPLSSIRGLVLERQQNSLAVEQEMAATWGGAQRLVGPLLVVPISTAAAATRELDPMYATAPSGIAEVRDLPQYLFVIPDAVAIDSQLRPELRRRGIYETILYAAETRLSGSFARPDLSGLDLDPERGLQWDKARLAFFVGDYDGIRDARDLEWNAASLTFDPGDPARHVILASLQNIAVDSDN